MQTIIVRATGERVRPEGIRRAAAILREGGLVAFPTETVYGLGADAMNSEAVHRIFAVKGRPADNPLILHVHRPQQLDAVAAEVPDAARLLVDAFWPGPLTVVLNKGVHVPEAVTAGLDTVAVRMPGNDVALSLLIECHVPVAAPSANLSGRPSPTRFEDVLEDLDGKVDCIIDGGDCQIGVESTVVDITGGKPRLLRPGAVTVENLESVVGPIEIDPHARGDLLSAAEAKPRSPGVKYRHYAPRAQVVLFEGDPETRLSRLSERIVDLVSQGKRVGVAATKESLPTIRRCARCSFVEREMGQSSDPRSIAATLFSTLRSLDRENVDVILVEGVDDSGVGFAVMNRLRKAAGGNIVRCQADR